MPDHHAEVPTLYLLRHAKSSWDDPSLDDHDRPLSPRGRKAVKRVRRHLEEAEDSPPARSLLAGDENARDAGRHRARPRRRNADHVRRGTLRRQRGAAPATAGTGSGRGRIFTCDRSQSGPRGPRDDACRWRRRGSRSCSRSSPRARSRPSPFRAVGESCAPEWPSWSATWFLASCDPGGGRDQRGDVATCRPWLHSTSQAPHMPAPSFFASFTASSSSNE